MILNTTTNRYEWNSGSDATPNWQPVGPTAVEMPVGGILEWPWASGSIPAWAILCYGQALAKASYPALNALASAAGYVYGSDTNNFNVPDMRGRVTAGKDDMGGTAASRITVAVSGFNGTQLGAVGGAEGITLTTAQVPAHNHAISGSPGLTGAPSVSGAPSLSGAPSISDPGHGHTVNDPQHTHQITDNRGYPRFYIGNGGSSGGSTTIDDSQTDGNNGPAFAASVATGVTVSGSPTGITAGLGSLAAALGSLTAGIGSLSANAGSLGTANQGGGGAHANTQPTIIVNKLMRAL